MKQVIMIALAGLVLCSCSSTPSVKGFTKDEVLATANDKSQPDWADETKPFDVRGGKVYSVGVTTLRGDERPEAGLRIAENNARSNFSKTIENRMEFIFQHAEENAGFDSTQSRYIGSEVSTLTSHAMKLEGSWYKRFAQSEEDGSRRVYYRIYSLVTMSEEDLKKAVRDSVEHRVAEKKLSPSFQEQVDRQWNKITDAKSDQPAPGRVPTSMKAEEPVQEVKPEVKSEVIKEAPAVAKSDKPAEIEKPLELVKELPKHLPSEKKADLLNDVIQTAQQIQ